MNPLVPDFILAQETRGRTEGNFAGAALFIDIPGFTQLTAKLFDNRDKLRRQDRGGQAEQELLKSDASDERAEEVLAGALRFYFDPLIQAVHEHGGFVAGFAGDAFTAVFPHAPGRNVGEHALAAALRMRTFFLKHPELKTKFGNFEFSYKVGLSWGAVEWGIVRVSPDRAFFSFSGPAIDKCSAIEHHAEKGDILMDAAFHQRFPTKPSVRSVGVDGVFKLLDLQELRLLPISGPTPPGDGAHFIAPGVRDMPPQGEFRQITTVFLSFDNIPSFDELIKLLYEHANRYGGTFTGVDSGDKGINCVIHFGAPIMHENDLERALDFVLGLRKEAPKGLMLRAGVTHEARYAGFNGGTNRREFACLGRATNLAARLMIKAPWRDIWCSPDVYNVAFDTHQFKRVGEHVFKGFDIPIDVYALDGKRVAAQREFHARGLIGREKELADLTRFVTDVIDKHEPGIIYVDGEPGLGKSFLVETFRRNIEDSRNEGTPIWIDARCDQTLRSSLNPFEYALKEYFGQAAATTREQRHAALDEALDKLIDRLPESSSIIARDLERARSTFGALIGVRWDGSDYERMDPKLRFTRSLEAIALWIRAESRLQPVVLHVEDAHWADGDSLEAIRHLASAVRDCPVAIICTCRNNDDGSTFRIELDEGVPEHAVTLGPLPKDKIVELATGLMGGPVSEILAVFLSENANGNPYFAQEIMTFWLEANQTRNKKDKDKEDTGVSTPSIFLLPNDVNSLLIARLDRLEPKVKRVVQAASVLGREFELRVLSRMMDDDVHLEEHIRVGEEQRLWLAMSKGRYRFGNVLLRNAAYEMQSRARLQDLHRRAAQAMQEIYADDVDSHATALGRHFQRAGKVEEARDNFLKGARKAAERYAHGEAKRLYRAYFKLTKDPTDESVVVHYEFALRVLETQGRFDEAIEEHRRVIDEAQRLGDRASEALGHLGLGRVNWSMGKFDNARAHYEHALITAREAGSVWHEGKALLALARLHRDQGRVDHARTFFEHALHNARKMSNPTEERAILADLALVYDQLGHVREAMALREQAFAIARAMRQA